MDLGLTGKIAVVTGANRGLGLEACRQTATMGYRAVLTARGKTKGERAVAGLRRDGLDAAFCQLDVTDAASVRRLARFVARQGGRLDALVNNAGILIDGEEGPLGLKVAALSRTFETNVAGPLRVAQALAPLMDRGGRIVNVSSSAGQFKNLSAHWPSYGVSKAALNALTKTLAREHARDGIRVNAVCPGPTDTPLFQSYKDAGDYGRRVFESISRSFPLRRIGQPEDLPGAVAVLISDDAAVITGQILSVSGGLTMQD